MPGSRNVRPPTQAEYTVILVIAQLSCFVLGVMGFGYWIFSPPKDPEQAELLKQYSAAVSVVGLLIWIGRVVIRRFIG